MVKGIVYPVKKLEASSSLLKCSSEIPLLFVLEFSTRSFVSFVLKLLMSGYINTEFCSVKKCIREGLCGTNQGRRPERDVYHAPEHVPLERSEFGQPRGVTLNRDHRL